MSELDAVRWFKDQFGAAVTEALTGTPFTLDMATAIAMQETYGDCWQFLYQTKTASQVLPLCVGDTLDYPNRTAFPRTKADLCQAPNGQQMFDIAHQALINVGQFNPAYATVAKNPNKFCHGYGIFQYDIQFFRDDPEFFLDFQWYDISQCVARLLKELAAALSRAYGPHMTSLTDEQMMYVAIAYNAGHVNVGAGPKQGYRDASGKYYGENFQSFLHLAHSVPSPTPVAPTQPPAGVAPPIAQPAAPPEQVAAPQGTIHPSSGPQAAQPSSSQASAPPTVSSPPPSAAPTMPPPTPPPPIAPAPTPAQSTFTAGQLDLVSLIQQASMLLKAAAAQSPQTGISATVPAVTAAQQLLKLVETAMAGAPSGSTPDASKQASTTSPNLLTLVPQILALVQGATSQSQPSGTQPTGTPSQAQIKQVVSILQTFLDSPTGQQALGQVNGALGQTIGNLLDGKKSAIGILGAMVTAVLQNVGPSLATAVPIVGSWAGLGSAAMPIFLGIAAWGALGKFEKWFQSTSPNQ